MLVEDVGHDCVAGPVPGTTGAGHDRVGTPCPVTPGPWDRDNERVYGLVGALAVAGGLVGASLHAVNAAAGRTVGPSFWLMQVAAALGYGLLTVVLRDRGTRALRLVVAGIAVGSATSLVTAEWASVAGGSTWPAWLGSWSWAPGYIAILALLPQLLPDGTLVSSRWRPVAWAGAAAVVVAGLTWALWPYEDQDFPGSLAGSTNPVGMELVSDPVFSAVVDVLLIGSVLAAAASLFIRWRRSRGVQRQQMKWVLLGLTATLFCVVLGRLLPMPLGEAMAAVAMLPLPAAIAVAVLRHGLWDVEVVFSRSLVYAAVAGTAVGGYVGAVWLIGAAGADSDGRVSLLAVALLAPLLLPVHAALQRRVNRWVHGDEEEPWDELARLGDRLATVADPDMLVDRVLPDVLTRVRRALRATTVRLRLADGTALLEGDEVSVDGVPTVVVPLRYAGEDLGTLEVVRSGGFGQTEQELLDRWAAQAAVAVHTVLLARESRRARELVVVAREEERRRLRRDLHDGVGPSVAALALQVETARDLATEDPEAAAGLLARLAPRINAVVADVRALVHELRPPTLDELGLAAAVRELAARLSGGDAEVDVLAEDLGPLPAAVEVATYRIVGEAVANAVRHARATRVVVEMRCESDMLCAAVRDDGRGIPDQPGVGLGLASMRARSEELGGTFAVASGPSGTTVTVRLPLGMPADEPVLPGPQTAEPLGTLDERYEKETV